VTVPAPPSSSAAHLHDHRSCALAADDPEITSPNNCQVLPSCHYGSVGSFTKAAEMMPVDFSGPAGGITSPTDLDTLLRMNRLAVSLARMSTGQKAVA
jgi:hypothetical protein